MIASKKAFFETNLKNDLILVLFAVDQPLTSLSHSVKTRSIFKNNKDQNSVLAFFPSNNCN